MSSGAPRVTTTRETGLAYDLTLHRKSVKRNAIRQLDFARFPNLTAPPTMEALLGKCEKIADDGFKNIVLTQTVLNGKNVYKIQSFEHELVLRLITKNLRRLTGARQTNRNSIVKSLKTLLQEGLDYKVFKFDLKTFYESVDVDEVVKELEKDRGFSRSHFKLLKSLFSELSAKNIPGLPRGLAISATLSEYVLRRFDKALSEREGVYFYERFVDDIIIVADPRETSKSISRFIRKNLPHGLSLNARKTQTYDFIETVVKQSETSSIHNQVNFLGYTFKVFQRQKSKVEPITRRVIVDISSSKTNKIKTRIVKSFMQFCADGDFQTLQNRIKLLSGNYTIFDQGRGVRRKAGIFFSYSIADPDQSNSLKELDGFLKKILLSNTGSLCSQLQAKLSMQQRRMLLKHSFLEGFKKRVFYNFSGSQLVTLMRCWKYA